MSRSKNRHPEALARGQHRHAESQADGVQHEQAHCRFHARREYNPVVIACFPNDIGILAYTGNSQSIRIIHFLAEPYEQAVCFRFCPIQLQDLFKRSNLTDSFNNLSAIPGVICPPSAPYTLYPLYSGGLWLAVITIPASAFKCRTAKDSSGVGRRDSKHRLLHRSPRGPGRLQGRIPVKSVWNRKR